MPNPDEPAVTTSPNGEAFKAVVRRNTEQVQGQGDFGLFDELFADDFIDHTPSPAPLRTTPAYWCSTSDCATRFPTFGPRSIGKPAKVTSSPPLRPTTALTWASSSASPRLRKEQAGEISAGVISPGVTESELAESISDAGTRDAIVNTGPLPFPPRRSPMRSPSPSDSHPKWTSTRLSFVLRRVRTSRTRHIREMPRTLVGYFRMRARCKGHGGQEVGALLRRRRVAAYSTDNKRFGAVKRYDDRALP